jgi:hypothetical protein
MSTAALSHTHTMMLISSRTKTGFTLNGRMTTPALAGVGINGKTVSANRAGLTKKLMNH